MNCLYLPSKKAGQGVGRGGISLTFRWVQPEAHSCKPAPGEGRGGARERRGGLLSPTNQTVTQTKKELTTQKGEEQMPRGGGGGDGGHSKPGYP